MSYPQSYNLRSQGPVDPSSSRHLRPLTAGKIVLASSAAQQELEHPTTGRDQLGREQKPCIEMANSITLQKFDGYGNQRADSWIEWFERYAGYYNMEDDRKVKCLPFYLDGAARTWYENLSQQVKADFGQLRTAFMERFKAQTRLDVTVLNIQQMDGESVAMYFNRFMTAIAGRNLAEDVTVPILLNGLKAEMKQIVMPQNIQSLDTLRQVSELAEQSLKSAPKSANASAVSPKDDMLITVCEKLDFLCSKFAEQDQKPHKRHHIDASRAERQDWRCQNCGGKRFHDRLRCPAYNKTCHYCNKVGHYKALCKSARTNRQ